MARWLRSVTALAVLITATVTVLVLPARPASAAVGDHHALTWNSNGANWETVSVFASRFDVIALQESGAVPGRAEGTDIEYTFGDWTVVEYEWPVGGGEDRYLYHLEMPATRNSLTIVSTEQAQGVYLQEPVPWRGRATANPSARPAFGIQLSDDSVWWTWHAGAGQSDSQRNDAANMITAIADVMEDVDSWAVIGDFNRDMLNPDSGFMGPAGWTIPADVGVVTPMDDDGNEQITRPASGKQLDYMVTNDMASDVLAQTYGAFSDHLAVQFGTTLVTARAAAAPPPGGRGPDIGQISQRSAPGTCLAAAVKPGAGIDDGTQVRPADCDRSADAQYWTIKADGSVSIDGACLDNYDGRGEEGNPVVLWSCHGGDDQTWVSRADGEIYNPATGKCLDDRPLGIDGKGLTLRTCSGADSQVFDVAGVHGPSPSPPVTGALELPDDGAGCLDHGLSGEGADVRAWACAPDGSDQRWTALKDDTIREGTSDKPGRCLDIGKGDLADGNPVVLSTCDGGDGQQWQLRDDDSVYNPASGKCLANGPRPSIRTCDGGVLQSWAYLPDDGVIQQTEIPTCVDHGRSGDGAPAQRALCAPGDTDQQWTRVNDGTLREGGPGKTGRCLDNQKAGPDDGNPVVLSTCDGGDGQQWRLRDDGSLHNPATDKCAGTDGGASVGAPFVLLPCTSDTGSWFSVKGALTRPADNPGCLDHGLSGAGAGTRLWKCESGSAGRQWTPMKDGTLREGTADDSGNRCLDTRKDSPAPGTPVVLDTCDGGGSQQWRLRKDGTVFNTAAKACLTDAEQPTIQTCGGDPRQERAQSWEYVVSEAVIRHVTAPTCVDHGQSGDGAPVRRRVCVPGDADQQWTAVKDGTLREGTAGKPGRCLDTRKGSPAPVVLATCDGGAGQQWDLRDDGTIHNPASGRCAGTDGGLAPGTPFVLLPCEPDLQWLLTGPEPDKKSPDTSSQETR